MSDLETNSCQISQTYMDETMEVILHLSNMSVELSKFY